MRSVAQERERQLRAARLELAQEATQHEDRARARDRRSVADDKEAARVTYRRAIAGATADTELQAAAAEWLREIHRLNRAIVHAERSANGIVRGTSALDGAAAQAEAAHDAARVAADLAEAACLEARQAVAACEEEMQRRAAATTAAVGSTAVRPGTLDARHGAARRPTRTADMLIPTSVSPLARLLQGDRAAVLGIALQLEEDTGMEAGRLQLLLVEMREIAVARAIEQHALAFPDGHPFWAQMGSGDEARSVVAALAAMGYRFDGDRGWQDNRVPTPRDLAMAVAHAGFDPRSVRRAPVQQQIDELWRGTRVLVEEYLLACAPDLELAQMTAALGPRASRLGELWDFWGRLRPLLAPA